MEAAAATEHDAPHSASAESARSRRDATRFARLTPLEAGTVQRLQEGATPDDVARADGVTKRAILRRLERGARRVEHDESGARLRRTPLPIVPGWRRGRFHARIAFAERWNAGASLASLAREFRTSNAAVCQRAFRIRAAAVRDLGRAAQKSDPTR